MPTGRLENAHAFCQPPRGPCRGSLQVSAPLLEQSLATISVLLPYSQPINASTNCIRPQSAARPRPSALKQNRRLIFFQNRHTQSMPSCLPPAECLIHTMGHMYRQDIVSPDVRPFAPLRVLTRPCLQNAASVGAGQAIFIKPDGTPANQTASRAMALLRNHLRPSYRNLRPENKKHGLCQTILRTGQLARILLDIFGQMWPPRGLINGKREPDRRPHAPRTRAGHGCRDRCSGQSTPKIGPKVG